MIIPNKLPPHVIISTLRGQLPLGARSSVGAGSVVGLLARCLPFVLIYFAVLLASVVYLIPNAYVSIACLITSLQFMDNKNLLKHDLFDRLFRKLKLPHFVPDLEITKNIVPFNILRNYIL